MTLKQDLKYRLTFFFSGTEQEDNIVSLDQLERQRETRESPNNSPTDRKRSNVTNKSRSPVIHKLPQMGFAQFQTRSSSKQQGSAANQNLNTELSMDMDLSDICTKGQEIPAKIDKAGPSKAGYCQPLDNDPTTKLERYAECLNSPAILPPAYDTAILQGSLKGNPDQCAPFIPPPSLCDEQMLSVNEKELEMFDLNTFGCDEFVDTEMWEISNYFDKMNQLPQNGLVKRNLSTPTFPHIQELNPEQ